MDNPHAFVRSILPRLVSGEEGGVYLRPPTVREAIIVLSFAEDAAQGDEAAAAFLLETLRGWYPADLYDAARRALRGGMADQVAERALALVHVGMPEVPEGLRAGSPATPGSVPWEQAIAEYMYVYGRGVEEALSEPFPAFVLMLRQCDRLRARATLEATQAAVASNMTREGLERMFADLKRRLGVEEESSSGPPMPQGPMTLEQWAAWRRATGQFKGEA